MIPKNNLDDRNFNDIVEEAIRLIPRYCPEWTNHNPSDPGITLVELFAWMTELTLYRLNQVPEKIYLSLLELMGLSLIPPQSARTIIEFFPVEGYRKPILIKANTQVAAILDTDNTFMFETEKDLTIVNNHLSACINRIGDRWSDYCKKDGLSPFTLFETKEKVEHILYIASPSFAFLEGRHAVEIGFSAVSEITSVNDEIINFLYWEYWNGRDWVGIKPQQTIKKKRKKDNVLYFTGPQEICPCTINNHEDYFLRGVLTDIPKKHNALLVKNIEIQDHFGGSGFVPDTCLSNSGGAYQPIDLNTAFRIFSQTPAYNEIFYLAADSVFSKKNSKVTIMYTFSELYTSANENENAQFTYEYWDGNSWKKLGESSRATDLANPFHFYDGTFGFKRSGEVHFIIPNNFTPTTVNNEEHLWLRVRLLTKDFSLGGDYVKDEKANWVWKFSSTVHSPIFSKIRVTYNAGVQKPSNIFSESNFQLKDIGRVLIEQKDAPEVRLFNITHDNTPSFYLGFTSAFPKGTSSIYFKIDDDRSSKPKERRYSFFNEDLFVDDTEKRLIDLAWEYFNGTMWAPLAINDYTDSFHESGFIEFETPHDMDFKEEFSKKLYWLRCRFITGSFETQPLINSVSINAVYAQNRTSHKNEIAGSGTGAPGQSLQLAHGPLLPGIELYIDEGSIPPTKELDLLKSEGIAEPCIIENDSVWVKHKEVENFYSSTPLSRHYVVDYQSGKILFGDGQRGVNPTRRKFNIKLLTYFAGGGSKGNVAAGTLKILMQSIPFTAGCSNPFPAEGGADMETVDNLKSRAAGVFKSLQRAVTAEDFQWLARESSASVGRAWCVKDKNNRGEICIIIIPVIPSGEGLSKKLIPSRELLRRVTAYLDSRKLVGTKICVQAPIYRTFNILLTMIFKSDVLDVERLKKEIENTLNTYFHALNGEDGTGWKFGKVLTVGAVMKQLEKVSGILSIDEVRIFDTDAMVVVEKLLLKDDEIPYLQDVRIENRRELE